MRLCKVTLFCALLAFSLSAGAQRLEKTYQIGVLSPDEPPPGVIEGLTEGLRELGYAEGKSIRILSRHSQGKAEQLRPMADDLVRLKVDVIVAINTAAAQAAKDATTAVPIVITRVADPVKTGLVGSLSRPGGNITGLSFQTEELSGKRLELLKEAIPAVSSVGLLWYTRNPGSTLIAREIEPGSARLAIRVLRLPVQSSTDFAAALNSASQDRVGALVVIDDAFITSHRTQIMTLATRHALPVMAQFTPFVEAGALLAYGPSERDMYRRAAHFIDKILKGAKPADLPIEQPTKYDLAINLRTAKSMGLVIPQSLLVRADRIVD